MSKIEHKKPPKLIGGFNVAWLKFLFQSAWHVPSDIWINASINHGLFNRCSTCSRLSCCDYRHARQIAAT
jgi:hypothetical protein